MTRRFGLAAALLLAAGLSAGPAAAQTPAAPPRVTLELNAAAPAEAACRLSFVALNGHGADIAKAVYEAVLFDTEGQVERLTLLDFGALPAGRPRVRQFVVPGLACPALGRVLINGAATCTGERLAADACTKGLGLSSRTRIGVQG